MLDSTDLQHRSELANIIINEIHALGLRNWFSDPLSAKSTRIRSIIEHVDKHADEHIVIFCCFKTFADVLHHYLTEDRERPVFMMQSSMNMVRRGALIEQFRDSGNGILLTTYQLSAEGLNLQFAACVMLCDYYWHASKTTQAIGRIFRYGQMASTINVYFFLSNTGIEQIIFEKQKAKLNILEELKVGQVISKIPKVNMDAVIRLIEMNDNKSSFGKIKYY